MSDMQARISADAHGDGNSIAPTASAIPPVVYLLGLVSFLLGTSEFMIAGMLPTLAQAFGVTVSEVGNLISLYAVGMVVGGPILTALLIKFGVPNKPALLTLLAIYVAGTVAGAVADSYDVMALTRLLTGFSGSACFGVAISIAAGTVAPDQRGRASSIVLGGLMLATVLGVPTATLVDQNFGWRASFWAIVALATASAAAIALLAPASAKEAKGNISSEFGAFRKGRLWAAYATSGLVMGATFSAFSYFSPIFTEVSGISASTIPTLLAVYGVATVIGNLVIGRYADRHIFLILTGGLSALAVALALFALFADNTAVSIAAFIVIGLAGLPVNPALAARVMQTVSAGPLVNTVHVSVINIGLAFGAWAGGLGIEAGYGLTSPLWIGFALAVIGLLSLAPSSARQLNS